MTVWLPFEGGETLGIKGTEGGTVIADEGHARGARITLERQCLRAPFAITCTLYGWAYHTRFLADEATAKQAYDDMKVALLDILDLLPLTEDDAPADAEVVEGAVDAFMERFP
jgi:hypothetical protein